MPRLSQTAASSILFGRVSDAALCSREPGEAAPNKGELAPTKREDKGERSPHPFLVPVYSYLPLHLRLSRAPLLPLLRIQPQLGKNMPISPSAYCNAVLGDWSNA